MASTKFVRQKPKLIKQKRNDENCDIEEKGVEFLEIDAYCSNRKIIQRIEHLLVDYFRKSFCFDKLRLDRKYSVWDEMGRVRVNKNQVFASDLQVNTSTNHAGLWLLISFVYERIVCGKMDELKIREVYYMFKDKNVYNSVNGVSRLIFSLVICQLVHTSKLKLFILCPNFSDFSIIKGST